MTDRPTPDPAALLEQAGAILDTAETEHRDLTGDERAEYDALLTRADRATKLARIADTVRNRPDLCESGFGAPAAAHQPRGDRKSVV